MKTKLIAVLVLCLVAIGFESFAQYGWARNDKAQKMWNWPKDNFVGIGTTGPTCPFEVYGNSKFTGVSTFVGSIALTGTISMTGLSSLYTLLVDQNKGTANIAVFTNDHHAVGDSSVIINKLGYMAIGKATATYPLDVVGAGAFSTALTVGTTLGVTGATTVTGGIVGTAITRGTGGFTTSGTRVAIAITGGTASDYYLVTPIASSASARPDSSCVLSVFAKTDSLIVQRPSGTISGLTFNYFRLK